MDPSVALREVLEELATPEPDRGRLVDLLDGLQQWIDRGGFLPEVKQVAGWEDSNGKTHPGFAVGV